MSDRINRQIMLFVMLMLTFGPGTTASAAARPCVVAASGSSLVAVMPADSSGVAKFFYGGGRTRIVQICAVGMAIALFIMMRKLN